MVSRYAWNFLSVAVRLRDAAVVLAFVAVALAAAGCNTGKALNSKGVAYYMHGHYDHALTSFQQAQARDPKNPHVYYNMARVYHHRGMENNDTETLEQAESHYHMCLDRDTHGEHRDCYRALAVLLMETGKSESAFTLLKGWSARHPQLAAPKVELARLYEEHGRLDLAKERLLEAIAIEPNNARALAALGKVREQIAREFAADNRHDEQERELAQALSNYRRSLQVDKQQGDVAARLAVLQSTYPRLDARVSPRDGRRLVDGLGGTRNRGRITPRL